MVSFGDAELAQDQLDGFLSGSRADVDPADLHAEQDSSAAPT
jgi:hypothetical protein